MGFNGVLFAIEPNPARNSILFGGQFDSTVDNFPRPGSQPINLRWAKITSSTSTSTDPNFNNASNVICSASANSNPWLLQSNQGGWWQARFPRAILPSLFRLRNSNHNGDGTKTFGILSIPQDDYLRLSYIDPITQKKVICYEDCVLTQNLTDFQEFTVENTIVTEAVRIVVNSWYGNEGGLMGVDIYHSEIWVHAVPRFNPQDSCTTNPLVAHSSFTGEWIIDQVGGNDQIVLYSDVNAGDNSTSVTYYPYLSDAGNYSVFASTPGCGYDNSCGSRTQVFYELHTAANSPPSRLP